MSSSERHRLSKRFKTLCAGCQERKARFRYRGEVRADPDHTLCFACFRGEINRARARRLADAAMTTSNAVTVRTSGCLWRSASRPATARASPKDARLRPTAVGQCVLKVNVNLNRQTVDTYGVWDRLSPMSIDWSAFGGFRRSSEQRTWAGGADARQAREGGGG